MEYGYDTSMLSQEKPQKKVSAMKPCPFCGGTKIDVGRENFGYWYAQCSECAAVIEEDTEKLVIEAWNRRFNNEED